MAYNGIISLISDTETRPTQAMRRAMAGAEVGDEQKGEDPTVNQLQERVADLLGKEAALWFPGGTMCNFVAIRVHTRPADAILADGMAHIVRAESAGAAFSSGVLIEPIASERGIFGPAQLDEALARIATAPPPYGPPPRLLCVEQTHNFGGGAVWRSNELAELSAHARARGLALHMDGARLMNAVVATGTSARSFAATVDSVWMDFTKGLGAPIGAVLAGSRSFITEARRQKHIFAGAMRQAGIAAAGCLHALDHHIERLAEDHEHARRLAAGLQEIPGVRVRTAVPETNMVFFDPSALGLSSATFLAGLAAHGVRMGEVRGEIRAVTHLDITRADIDTTLAAIRTVASTPGAPEHAPADHRPY
ncbi:threonine aldolase family protein [Pendulispora albinea]|uniref:Beta-eliminating lyase-related protein n=1 Tax=Pendulispora albinea TaxID=2741071 RepID=A0ABZ2LMJ8_9BACT